MYHIFYVRLLRPAPLISINFSTVCANHMGLWTANIPMKKIPISTASFRFPSHKYMCFVSLALLSLSLVLLSRSVAFHSLSLILSLSSSISIQCYLFRISLCYMTRFVHSVFIVRIFFFVLKCIRIVCLANLCAKRNSSRCLRIIWGPPGWSKVKNMPL